MGETGLIALHPPGKAWIRVVNAEWGGLVGDCEVDRCVCVEDQAGEKEGEEDEK